MAEIDDAIRCAGLIREAEIRGAEQALERVFGRFEEAITGEPRDYHAEAVRIVDAARKGASDGA